MFVLMISLLSVGCLYLEQQVYILQYHSICRRFPGSKTWFIKWWPTWFDKVVSKNVIILLDTSIWKDWVGLQHCFLTIMRDTTMVLLYLCPTLTKITANVLAGHFKMTVAMLSIVAPLQENKGLIPGPYSLFCELKFACSVLKFSLETWTSSYNPIGLQPTGHH